MEANGWTERTLGDLISLDYGTGLPSDIRSGARYPVFGSSGEIGRHSDYTVSGPGIVVGRKGTVGSVTWSPESFWPIDTTYYVVPRESIDLRWCYRLLTSLPLQRLDSSTGVPGLNRNDAYQLPVVLPPLPEQRRIAEILDTVDDAIRKTEELIAKLKQIKAGLLHDLLTCGIDDHGRLRDPVAHPEQFKDSPLGRIPGDWEVETIGSLAIRVGSGVTPRGGSEVYTTEGALFIRSQNVTFRGLVLDDVAYIDLPTHDAMSRSEVFPFDVLLNITGASIGRCCYIPDGQGIANVNQHVCAIRLPDANGENANFLSSVLASHIGQSQIDRLNAGGNRQGLNYQQLRSFIVPWPSSTERAKIARMLDNQDARIHTEERYCDKLEQLKNGLMEDLLTGRVRVAGEVAAFVDRH